MNIFLSCFQSKCNHPVPAYQFWETYLKSGIAEAQHKWIEAADVDWAEGMVYSNRDLLARWRERTWNRTVSSIKRQLKTGHIELFLSYLFPQQIEPSAINEIRSLGIPCVNFFCDNVREFTRVPREFYCFDLHWVPEFKAIEMYERANLNYLHAPMPVWIPPAHRYYQHPENYGVTFIGSRDVQRDALLAQVIKLGVSLEIRGSGWGRDNARVTNRREGKSMLQTAINQGKFFRENGTQGWLRRILSKFQPSISDDVFADSIRDKPDAEQYIEITQQSLITLGVNRYPSFRHPFSRPDTYSRLRDIEAPMMGAGYLTEWAEGLDQLYELGEEIETYLTAEEMVEKIKVLSSDIEKRRRMRYQGQKRALAHHTIGDSISKIRNALGIDK